MFERILSDRLEKIFGLKKITFDRPGESQEQEAAFVEISNVRARISDGRQKAQVHGRMRVFAQLEKLPFGYLSKRIADADADDKADFFFGNEENHGTFRNIAERSMEFVFLFDSQYDPAIGTLTSINLTSSES